MANISSFFGTLTIPADVLQICKTQLCDFISNYSSPWYGVNDFYVDIKEIERAFNVGSSVDIPFYGSGRWSACGMFEADGATFFYPDPNMNPAAEPLIQSLRNCALPINYTDEEGGCMVLYTFDGEIQIDQHDNVSFVGDFTDYNYSSKNLYELDIYDECIYDFDEDENELLYDVAERLNMNPYNNRLIQAVSDVIMDSRYEGVLIENDLEYFFDDVAEEIEKGGIAK